MVSGIDTDATVKKLIQIERTKVDRAEQDKQLLEWKQEQYREVSALLKTFQDDYFNVLKPQNNLMSTSAFNVFTASTSSSAVSAKTSGSSHKGEIQFASIGQLATKDRYTSDAPVVGSIEGSAAMAAPVDLLTRVNGGDNTLTFSLDGVSKTITLDPSAYGNYATHADFVQNINDQLATAFPSVAVTASENGGVLSFDIAEAGHKLKISSAHPDLLADLKLQSGQSNVVNLKDSLANLFGLAGDVDLTINGVSDFGITADDSVEKVIEKINNSSAGVTLSYDEMSDRFRLEADREGVVNTIDITDTSGLLNTFKLNDHTAAQDAQFVLNTDGGQIATSRSSNSFTIDGTNVTLKETSATPVTITIDANGDSVKDNIVKFVDAYNKILDKINTKTTEKRYRDFKPLTDAQKKELEDDDEKKWQEKAQSGLLRGDKYLLDIADKMRRALYEKVEGVGITLKDIGITTSSDYRKGGRLSIDENKLDQALQNRPNDVIALFSQKSDKDYLDGPNAKERYSESGLAQRLNDILNDNIRITKGGGNLIRKAGQKGVIDTKSDLYNQIKASDKKIDKLLEMLSKKEEKYYMQFARMESMLQKYNAQSGWLMQQFGGM